MNASALFNAAKAGDISVLDNALSAGSAAVVGLRDSEGDALGHVAARKGHLQFLRRLIQAGMDADIPNKKGRRLVHEAAKTAQLHVLKYLHSIHADFRALTLDGTRALISLRRVFAVLPGDSVLDVAKNLKIENYLEVVLETDSVREQSRNRPPVQRRTEKCGKLSSVREIQSSELIVPGDTAIVRTAEMRELGNVSAPVCRLQEVGWGDEDDLGFPKRPEWRALGLDSADVLHSHEERLFHDWLQDVDAAKDVCSFERNLEYWRQLWRVMERGHVYLIIVDARIPLLHIHKGFLSYLKTAMNRPVVLCLNKCDLVDPELVDAWKEYVTAHLEVEVVTVSCKDEGQSRAELLGAVMRVYPAQGNDPSSGLMLSSLGKDAALQGTGRDSRTVEEIVGMNAEALLKWRDEQNSLRRKKKLSKKAKARIEKERAQQRAEDTDDDLEELLSSSDEEASDSCRDLVISVIGEPNVGKSSVINSLLGIKRVSVSAHPGRTKHLQTHYLGPCLLLCDCPGLVFPKRHVPFSLQVLFGGFPIARCRDVYSVIQFLAERICPDLPAVVQLGGAIGSSESPSHWSVLDICEALAGKNKWTTHRGGRWDVYRAANWILRGALAGRDSLVLAFAPP